MSKSLEFCIDRALNPKVSSYYDRNWKEAIENEETEAWFDDYIQGERKFLITGTNDNEEKISLDLEISFDSNANFDYFTSESCIHDGTAYFIVCCMEKVMNKVLNASTYNKLLFNDKDILNAQTIKYIIGNFVILDEFGDFSTKEKPWLKDRTTILLPLKQIII